MTVDTFKKAENSKLIQSRSAFVEKAAVERAKITFNNIFKRLLLASDIE